ncbi:MAG: response regulator [Calditrichales bacterium]|nr:MAG: response regulator [Calditrichales bacterium]
MPKVKVLVVDDEESIIELVEYNLLKAGYEVSSVNSGEAALKRVKDDPPEVILLDLFLPGVDGLEVCRILKQDPQTRHIPILMITAKGEESDIVAGLELGADDYITKPFSPKVLIARMRTVLRRVDLSSDEEAEAVIQFDALYIDTRKHLVTIDGEPIGLTHTEFQLLHFLGGKPGWVFTRSQIVDALKGTDYPVTDRSVDVQVVGLRKKLAGYGSRIETVRGVGYRFKE